MKHGENCVIMSGSSTTKDIVVELGWTSSINDIIEIDACCFLLNQEKRVRNDKDFIFYNQNASVDGSVVLNSSPKKSANSSEFYISLSRIPNEIVRIVIAITIYQAEERRQNFSMLDYLYIKIKEQGQQIACYELRDANEDTTQVLGNIYRFQDSWKFCSGGQGFKVGLDILADKLGVNVITESTQIKANSETKAQRARCSIAATQEDSIRILQEKLISFLPKINAAVEQKDNESKTRMILDRIFTDVFDYKIDEIKAEQKIQGRRADYVLSVNGNDTLVVEVKRAGLTLREKQIFQATSYGAYSGIKWALLTNLQEWRIYCVSVENKVEADFVFSVNLSKEPTFDDCKNLLLISKNWIAKKNMLENLWNETRAVSRENIIRSILSEDVVNKIRLVVNRDSGCNISHEDIQKALEDILGITSG
jgi:stress response protein SCP2/predicted type IV restriction endonuclease